MTDIVEDFLEHFGVKGMRWGQRKQRQIDSLRRVASGKGSLSDKRQAIVTSSISSLVKGKGLKGAAEIQAKQLSEHKERMESGKAFLRDYAQFYASLKLSDLKKAK